MKPANDQEIEIGDFVRSRLVPLVCGFVVRRGQATLGRDRVLAGYIVRDARGHEQFIDAASIERIARGDDGDRLECAA